jgi:SpoVK/Ycf46/Vps4 family AAA+-type ATPase
VQVVNGPELLSEFVGDSEACMRALFVAARAVAPSIVFFDEIDALAPARAGMAAGSSGAPTETSARVLGTLLLEMDAPRVAEDQYVLSPTPRSSNLVAFYRAEEWWALLCAASASARPVFTEPSVQWDPGRESSADFAQPLIRASVAVVTPAASTLHILPR